MKKGFTLIELLAVIVILAIIALIATPIVLNIINDTKESAILRSADFYIDALENEIMLENMKQGGNFNPTTCTIVNKVITCDSKEINLKVDGEVPTSGSITFEEGKVKDVNLTYPNGTVTLNNKGELVLGESSSSNSICTYQDIDNSNTVNFSDIVTCSSESFYVMDNNGTDITMLAMYNLDVGYIGSYVNGLTEIENPTGLQSENAKGYGNYDDYYGITHFATKDYWLIYDELGYPTLIVDANYLNEGRSRPYVYGDYKDAEGNQQNLIYPYVNSYKQKLEEMNIKVKEARLISYEEAYDIKTNKGNPSWLYNTSYWMGSSTVVIQEDYYNEGLYYVVSDGTIPGYDAGRGAFVTEEFGVRPVVVIDSDMIG